jgi:hypothetical protein
MRPHPALVELAAGRPLPPVDDHDELARSALEHRMGGLLWSQLSSSTASGSVKWRERLAGADLLTRSRHQHLWRSLVDVSRQLAAEGVAVAAFKGVPAERRWYARMGDRPCSDLDLLVDPGHLHRLDAAIELIDPRHPLRGRVGDLVARGRLQSIELQTADGIAIDLHADAFKLWVPSRRDVVWSRVVDVDAPDGGSVRALDAEGSLVQFLIHITKDRFRWLLGYADVARVAATPDLDHEFVAWWVRAEGLDVHYRSAMEAVAKTLDLDLAVLSPSRGSRAMVWHAVWRPAIRLRGDEGVVRFRHRQVWVTLLARGRTAAKARFLARKVVPDSELVAYRRPGRGPMAWRLTWGRASDAVRRWQAGRRLR